MLVHTVSRCRRLQPRFSVAARGPSSDLREARWRWTQNRGASDRLALADGVSLTLGFSLYSAIFHIFLEIISYLSYTQTDNSASSAEARDREGQPRCGIYLELSTNRKDLK
jgi:hypothetical protein